MDALPNDLMVIDGMYDSTGFKVLPSGCMTTAPAESDIGG
jgi:hypothetical protein